MRALELGAVGIELDVHATSDGVVVVHHDPVVHGNNTDGATTTAPIGELSQKDLAKFPLTNGARIPTLIAVLDSLGDRVKVYVEIKATDIEPLVVRCIRESRADCAVHSFDHRIVRNVKKIFPAIRTGVLEVARHIDPVASLAATGAEDLWQHVDYIDRDLVNRAHAVGARVIAWTANDPAQWELLTRLGVDGICTDNIGELAAAER
ncbi:MAG: glycerophosphodiester phosphodiesterase [Gemmatimonadaceae bacterium]